MSQPLPGASAAGARRAAPKRKRWGRWVALALGLVVVAGLAAFAWDGWQLKSASAELRTHAAAAKAAVSNRDADALVGEVAAVQESAATFAKATSGPQWWVASWIPWVKNQTVPLQQAGDSVQAIADDALGPLAEMDDLSALTVPAIVDGRIDPNVLEPYKATLASSAAVFATQQQALADVSLEGTISQVREPFIQLRTELGEMGETVQGAHVAAEVLPGMLGADGPRTYLVMVQNNAEPRATGGIPGAVLEVSVDDGHIELKRYVSANQMIDREGIDVPLTPDEENIFGGRMVKFPQATNFTPEYPRTAVLIEGFWKNEFGESVDGVVSVDPVALGYMLEGMEPLTVGKLTITGPTLAQVMLNESYLAYPDPADQDVFFTQASGVLFGVLAQGQTSAIAGTERAIDEHRFMVWSGHEDEQQLLQTTTIAGGFLERADTLGVFVNDGSGSKIGYYIDSAANVVNHMCADGSLGGQTLTVTLTHTFDGSVAELPWYISGGGQYVPEGEFHANVLLYPPNGEGVTKVTANGEAISVAPQTHDGRRLATARIVLVPGETVTLEYQLTANQRGILAPSFQFTPGPKPQVNDLGVDYLGEGC